ncbi:MAG: lamin tail domain-containing protein [Patescibacteria group bacterium]|nr:lamin tail domain-containing protein [Patescibacteria group bacterium]
MIFQKANILTIILAFVLSGSISTLIGFSYFKYFQKGEIDNLENNFISKKTTIVEDKKYNSNLGLKNNELSSEEEITYQEIDYQVLNENLNLNLNNEKQKNKIKLQKENRNKPHQEIKNRNIKNENKNNKVNNSDNQNLLANFLTLLNNLRENDKRNENTGNNSLINSTSNLANNTNTLNLNNRNNSGTNQNFNNNRQNNNQQNNNNNNNNQNQNNNNNNNQNNNQQQNNNEDNNIGNQAISGKVLISEILIDGGNSTDEYIELYNPNNFEINLSGWKLIKFNKNGNQQTFIGLRTRNTFENKIIRPYSYFLIANENGSYSNRADIIYAESYNLARDNSIMLINNNDEIVDLVGWGSAVRYETTAFNQNPPQGLALVRKAGMDSNSQSMTTNEINFGNSLDTNNNNFDFLLISPEPQNSQSQPEIPPIEISLINFEDLENRLLFEIISPYQELSNSYYALLSVDTSEIDENQNINDYIRGNWPSLRVNVYLPAIEFWGRRQRIEINFNPEEERAYLLSLVSNQQIINWVPDLND